MSTRARSHWNRGHGLKLAACAVGLLALGVSEPLRGGAEPFPGSGIASPIGGTPIAGTLACPDTDADSFADCSVAGCDDIGLTCGDCDDADTGVNPGEAEVCNHADDDCDGLADEGFAHPTSYVSVQDAGLRDESGWAVAGIGDVTGDGVEDFVTGMPSALSDSGTVVLYSGATRSVVCRAVHPGQSGNVDERLGSSVSAVPDMNMDGRSDFLAGAPADAPRGSVFLFSGANCAVIRQYPDPGVGVGNQFGFAVGWVADLTMDGVPEVVASGHDSVPGGDLWRINVFDGATGAEVRRLSDPDGQVNDQLGFSVAGLGDVNFDGVPDIAAGARLDDTLLGNDVGSVQVYSGADGSLIYKTSDGSGGDELGYSLAALDDIDGDGVGDLAAGAPTEDTEATNAGMMVLFSGVDGSVIDRLTDPLGAMGDQLGNSLSAIPDLTGDGVGEIVAGAWGSDPKGTNSGSVFIFDPSTGAIVGTELVDPAGAAGDLLGRSVSAADVTGDGAPEILIGAPMAESAEETDVGKVVIVSFESDCDGDGSSPFGSDCDDTDASNFTGNTEICDAQDNDCDTEVDDDDDGDGFGVCDGDCDLSNPRVFPGAAERCDGLDDDCDAVADDGPDADLDGFEAPCDCDDGDDAVFPGAVEVCNRRDDDCDGFIDEGFTGPTVQIKLTDPEAAASDQMGVAVAGIGDADGDRVDDFVVGISVDDHDSRSNPGSVLLFSGFDRSVLCRAIDPIPGDNDGLGFSVAAVGDVDGDARADFAAGAPMDDDITGIDNGSVVLFSGADCSIIRKLLDPSPGFDGRQLGYSVAATSDLTGDGISDVVAGAPLETPAFALNGGSVTVFNGATGAVLFKLSDRDGRSSDGLGRSVAGLGDVNFDGVPDIAAGAHGDDNLVSGAVGSVQVYSGANGSLIYKTFDPGVPLGFSLAALDDVDGDGVNDFAAGSPNEAANAGMVVLFSGRDGSVIDRLADPSGTTGDQLGQSLAAVPDLSGDGLSDLIAGAWMSNAPLTRSGSAFLFDTFSGAIIGSELTDATGASGDGFGVSVATAGDIQRGGRPEVIVGASQDDDAVVGSDAGSVVLFSFDEYDCDADGVTPLGGDCNDTDPGTPSAEVADDGIDQDCNGFDTVTCFVDGDRDAFGSTATTPAPDGSCDTVESESTLDTDCDDAEPLANPGRLEVCDGLDNDCSGSLPPDEADADGDGFPICLGDCDDSDGGSFPGGVEACDGADNDCSGSVPAGEADADSDGFRVCDGDCDDGDGTIHFDAPEICDDLVDNDCDMDIDGADLDCAFAVTTCSTLGDSVDAVDQDIWTLTGTQGETVTVDLVASGTGAGTTNLYLVDDAGAGFFLVDRGELPSRIVGILPASGAYRVAVVQQPKMAFLPGARFAGDYCLTVEGDQGSAATLLPTTSVESTIPVTGPTPPDPGGRPAPSARGPFDRAFDRD